ncbi:MAG: dynamin family protein, partial [Pseudomonadales bacterium]|nr:dynamin family protein [Pseudomonadales bacterium]
MSKQALLTQAIQNYQFDDMQAALDELSVEDKTLLIGVLGEFSSGKSSLINAMLGQATLLAFEKPTTAAIVEIAPQNNITSNATFIRQPDGQLTAISPNEFDEFVLKGEKNLVGVLNVPSSKILVEGYRIVDTPGIVSLEDTHEDITFGYLPFLDGAIVCQDINKGGLTQSLKDFLSKPDVRPFL